MTAARYVIVHVPRIHMKTGEIDEKAFSLVIL